MYRQIDFNEFKKLYQEHMIYDFPADELKTLAMYERLFMEDVYTCYVYEKEQKLLGYACFVWKNQQYQLLDYFAVNRNFRGSGVGSEMLSWIQSKPIADVIILECEDPDFADSEQEKKVREDRIRFYLKNGAVNTGFKLCVHHVEFVVLILPIKVTSEFNLEDYLFSIYHMINPKLLDDL
ncbi:GNAT family N-acetyltransferase [Vagococcus vulneris]|uniref:N-acetyltransferase domain-containing protein n=1 Tax=Vagococcus vulneris TaxID=1977869 RepID=A0A430A200_9ENTE|nr:GNAT family N-acetyltransferase [Vagococcus vulneris]RSU00460.1 hypothetical protein CBF37_00155 [Vagococcus vulneris]